MENNLLTEVFYALIPVVVVVVTVYLLPTVKQFIDYLKLNELDENEKRVAETIVRAVEQILGSGAGKQKLKEAEQRFVDEMSKRGVQVDPKQVRDKIEEAVYDMNLEQDYVGR